MTTESIVGLMTLTWSQYVPSHSSQAISDNGQQNQDLAVANSTAKQYEPSWHLTPNSWVVSGLVLSTVTATLLIPSLFNEGNDAVVHVKVWVPLVGIVIAAGLSILAVRALGATDLNPVNALGKVSENMSPFLKCH